MFRQIWNMMCEDNNNQVIDPLRAGFVSGMGIYLIAGIALIAALLHVAWFKHDPVDFQSYGIACGAWAGGLGVLLTGAGFGIFGKSKGDAVAP